MLESNLVKRTVKHDMVSPVGRGFDRVTAFFIFYHALSRAFKTHGTLIGVTMSKKDQFIANMQAAEHRGPVKPVPPILQFMHKKQQCRAIPPWL